MAKQRKGFNKIEKEVLDKVVKPWKPPYKFEITSEVIEAKVLGCLWNAEIIGQTISIMQTQDNFFSAIDFQDDLKPWRDYGLWSWEINISHN